MCDECPLIRLAWTPRLASGRHGGEGRHSERCSLGPACSAGVDTEVHFALWRKPGGGESAGAGSITHHLIAKGGKERALFKRAVIQSPAYDYHVERKGHLEKQFKEFESYAGCAGKGLACLRAAPIDTIVQAQRKQLDGIPGGKPGVGCVFDSSTPCPRADTSRPAADGVFVRQAAPLEFAAGKLVLFCGRLVLKLRNRQHRPGRGEHYRLAYPRRGQNLRSVQHQRENVRSSYQPLLGRFEGDLGRHPEAICSFQVSE
jgi:hypothetical protein